MNSSFSWEPVLLLVDRGGGLGIGLRVRATTGGVLWFCASREVIKFVEAPAEVEVGEAAQIAPIF